MPTIDELRAATDRLRRCVQNEFDAALIISAYLAEHPADGSPPKCQRCEKMNQALRNLGTTGAIPEDMAERLFALLRDQ